MSKLFKRAIQVCIASVLLSVLWVWTYAYLNPPISMYMLHQYFTEDSGVDFEWQDIEKISPEIPMAFIASEDQLFLEHSGFDLNAIEKAIQHNQKHKNTRGASTISQQVAKNLFLVPSRSYVRKGFEAYFTALIELLWSKKRIMEVYLNIVEMGKGVYGVPRATEIYFNLDPNQVGRSQAALLAVALPNPKVYSLERPSSYMYNRSRWVMRQMSNLGGAGILKDWYE